MDMTHSGVRYAFFGVVLLDVYPTFGGRCLQFLTTQKTAYITLFKVRNGDVRVIFSTRDVEGV